MLNQTTINGTAHINGMLNAQNSTFNDIVIRSENITFINSTVNNITIKESSKAIPYQNLELIDSKILGDIIFEKNNGKIFLKGNSQVMGKIKGGEIIK